MICQACGLDKKVVSKKYDFLGKLGIATRNDLSVDVPLQFWVGRARRVTQDTARADILALTLCLRYAAQRALRAAVAVSFPTNKDTDHSVGVFVWWGKLDSDQRSQ